MIRITHEILKELSENAANSDRLRKNKNYHPKFSDTLQRMLNAMEPGTYVQPHKHENPDKREIFVILSGRVLVIEFDDQGKITDYIILDNESGNLIVEIQPRIWHTVISLQRGSVVYEIKDGPYDMQDDKNFATWAPKEGEAGCVEYNKKLLEKILE